MRLNDKEIAKLVKPHFEKAAKTANRELERLYARGENRSDRAIKRDIETIAKKHGFEGVDAKGMTAAYRDGKRTLFKAG